MKNFSIVCRPEVIRGLKILAVQHGTRMGDTLDGLLRIAAVSPPLLVARAMAAADRQEGCPAPEGEARAHTAQEKALGALPEEF